MKSERDREGGMLSSLADCKREWIGCQVSVVPQIVGSSNSSSILRSEKLCKSRHVQIISP